MGVRSILSVPLLHEGNAIGTIGVARGEPGRFADEVVGLLQTFARQAVIAIQNTRLFKAEQASKREVQESLEYQTATSEVLAVIARSPNQLQPVLDAICVTAAGLCDAEDTGIFLRESENLRYVANYGKLAGLLEPLALSRDSVSGRTVVDAAAVHVVDLQAARDEFPLGRDIARSYGHRTALGIPLLRDGKAIGCVFLRRTRVEPFTDKQVALLQTFANQAVIAISNVGLFEEVQARTKELAESLEYQTATSEVLAVISRSPDALQPVVDSISETAVRLCGADCAFIRTLGPDGQYHAVSFEGVPGQIRRPHVEPNGNSGSRLDCRSCPA
jgi:GAF domain-containing protein